MSIEKASAELLDVSSELTDAIIKGMGVSRREVSIVLAHVAQLKKEVMAGVSPPKELVDMINEIERSILASSREITELDKRVDKVIEENGKPGAGGGYPERWDAVGSYLLCVSSSPSVSPGEVKAGGNLRPSDAFGSTVSLSIPGNWKCVSRVSSASRASFFLRVS